jgi:hypothetical protein
MQRRASAPPKRMQWRAAARAKKLHTGAGASMNEYLVQRRAAAWPQIGAGKRAWIPARGGQKDAVAGSSAAAGRCRLRCAVCL